MVDGNCKYMGGFRYVKVGVIMYSMDTALSLCDYSENSLGNMKYRNGCTYMYIHCLLGEIHIVYILSTQITTHQAECDHNRWHIVVCVYIP